MKYADRNGATVAIQRLNGLRVWLNAGAPLHVEPLNPRNRRPLGCSSKQQGSYTPGSPSGSLGHSRSYKLSQLPQRRSLDETFAVMGVGSRLHHHQQQQGSCCYAEVGSSGAVSAGASCGSQSRTYMLAQQQQQQQQQQQLLQQQPMLLATAEQAAAAAGHYWILPPAQQQQQCPGMARPMLGAVPHPAAVYGPVQTYYPRQQPVLQDGFPQQQQQQQQMALQQASVAAGTDFGSSSSPLVALPVQVEGLMEAQRFPQAQQLQQVSRSTMGDRPAHKCCRFGLLCSGGMSFLLRCSSSSLY